MKKYLFVALLFLSSCSSKNYIAEYRKNELLKVADRVELIAKQFQDGELEKNAVNNLMQQLSATIRVIIWTCEGLELLR